MPTNILRGEVKEMAEADANSGSPSVFVILLILVQGDACAENLNMTY